MDLVCLNTVSPFCLCNRRSANGCFYGAASVAKELCLKLISIDVAQEFLEIVKNPQHGYGSNMNPCIDCRILLFKKAKEAMQKEGASFLITGEVLGQRPMSQRLNTMRLIEREAGLEGLVLRPLSAKALGETLPEKNGWVAREALLAISGRGRRGQMALAEKLGVNDYPCPSGGCLLTDPQFSRRLKDLICYGRLNLEDVYLLKVGRHFRLNEQAKLVVGRNEPEDGQLLNLARDGDYLFMPGEKMAGPTCIGRGEFSRDLLRLSCRVALRYCDLNGDPGAEIIYRRLPAKSGLTVNMPPLGQGEIERMRI